MAIGTADHTSGGSMPTLRVYPTAPGRWSGWSAVYPVGSEGWSVIDDDPHNSDTDYMTIPSQVIPTGRASFRFGGATNIAPTSIDVFCVARKVSGGPWLQLGFARGDSDSVEFDASDLVMLDSYVEFSRSFSTSPFSGAAWTVAEMLLLEMCVQSKLFKVGNSRVTAMYADLNYAEAYNVEHRAPAGSIVA